MIADGRHDTVIIGGGQAGLAMSCVLHDAGREHVVFERAKVAERWSSERWDSLRFQFPSWTIELPDARYEGTDPEGFAGAADIAGLLERYAVSIGAPVVEGCDVTALDRDPSTTDLVLAMSSGEVRARNVVVATGPFQRPAIPAFSRAPAEAGPPARSDAISSARGSASGCGSRGRQRGIGAQIADDLLRAPAERSSCP